MAQSNVPVMQSVRAALQFWRGLSMQAAGALAVLAVAATVQGYFNYAGSRALGFATVILVILAGTMAVGALFRLAMQDEQPDNPEIQPRPLGLQWAATEWRLLGVQLLLMLFMVIALVVGLFVLGIATILLVGSAVGQGAGPEQIGAAIANSPGGFLLLLLVLILVLALVYTAVRLTLAQPATVDRGRVLLFETWPLTKGQFWPIFGTLLLVNSPSLVLGMLSGSLMSAFAPDGEAGTAAVLEPGPALFIAVLNALVMSFVQTPLTVGLYAYLYRGLRPMDAPVAATTHAP